MLSNPNDSKPAPLTKTASSSLTAMRLLCSVPGTGFVSSETRLSSDEMISVQQAMTSGAVAMSNGSNQRRKLITTGNKEVLRSSVPCNQ
jgi:hypothetical protein